MTPRPPWPNSRLKDAVDLDAVQADLTSAVQQTLEPAHVSVWISHRDGGWLPPLRRHPARAARQ
jgi:hypothetical protein